jgi:hypothetical protein
MHPLAPDLTNLSDEDLHTKRGELQSKLSRAYQMGSADMVGQLQLLIQDYAMEVERRNAKLMATSNRNVVETPVYNITKE